jgi:hypothetical protein
MKRQKYSSTITNHFESDMIVFHKNDIINQITKHLILNLDFLLPNVCFVVFVVQYSCKSKAP